MTSGAHEAPTDLAGRLTAVTWEANGAEQERVDPRRGLRRSLQLLLLGTDRRQRAGPTVRPVAREPSN